MKHLKIEFGSVDDIVDLSAKLPEFDKIMTREFLLSRLDRAVSLILVARIEETLVGYKIGYELTKDTFYSWLGGVVPKYRKNGIATILLNYQENYLRNSGYKQIKVKSMNRFPNMLRLLISKEYEIVSIEEGSCLLENKIVFIKNLAINDD